MFFNRWHVLWAFLLTFAWPVKAQQQQTLLDFKGYPQQLDHLCWAATAQSVINSEILDTAQTMLKSQCDVAMAAGLDCNQNPYGNPEDPLIALLPPTYVVDKREGAMSFDDLSLLLNRDKALPIPFGIRYCDLETLTECYPSTVRLGGNHFLLVTGYSEVNGEQLVAIYDPWPVNAGSPALDSNGPTDAKSQPYTKDSTWVSYGTFANNIVDFPLATYLGIPYEHLADYVVRPRGSAPPRPPTSLCVDGGCSALAWRGVSWSMGAMVRFSTAMSDSRSAALLHLEVMQRRPGSRPNLQIAEPLPIVALDTASLDGAEQRLTSLLKATTARVVYPVIAEGVVRDAFILNRAVRQGQTPTWLEGGFANAQIVTQLVNARSRQPTSSGQRSPFYLVSIPQLRVFLLAQGSGRNATLIALADRTDLMLSSREGDFVRAGVSYPARVLMPVLRLAASRQQAG